MDSVPIDRHVFEALRVIEIAGDPAGEMLGKLLAQMGADVVKVEPPEGSPTRRIGPFAGDVDDDQHSLTFWYYNTNKRSSVVDYRTATGKKTLLDLVRDADVCITTLAPPELDELGLRMEDLRGSSESVVIVSITPFGLDGPWANRLSSDLVGLALGGLLNSCGYDDHAIPPIRPGGDQAYQSACSFALMALMLALIERQHSGRGQLVDIAMHDCLAVNGELANPYWFYPKAIVRRQTCRHAQPTGTAPALFATGDGRYVYFAQFVADTKQWKTLVEWMESLDIAADVMGPEYDDPAFRQANFPHIQEMVEVLFMLQTADEAYHNGQAHGLPIGVLYSPDDLFENEHLLARGFFVDVDHADGSSGRYPGPPIRFTQYAPAPTVRAPRLGEHTDEELARMSGE